MFVISCVESPSNGFLYVSSAEEGQLEIYKIKDANPIHFESEQLGDYNQTIPLTAGSYLVLADCSHKIVTIRPASTVHLTTHIVEFIPPSPPKDNDKFSIQCSRFEDAQIRQVMTQKYKISLLTGFRKILVGMVPIELELTRESSPSRISYHLASLRVSIPHNHDHLESELYFISPKSKILSITDSQSFNEWQHLLPGEYTVEVNGMTQNVDLKAGEKVTLPSASIKVRSPIGFDPDIKRQVLGALDYYTLEKDNLFSLDVTYPVLPGSLAIRLGNSSLDKPIKLNPFEHQEIKTKAVMVERGCSPWEWKCLGGQGIQLYLGEEHYPFLKSVTDVPLLYIGEDIWLEIEGSRNIHYRLNDNESLPNLKLGEVELVPKPTLRSGWTTDLIRIETQEPFRGHSLDLSMTQKTKVPLIAGKFQLAQYINKGASESDRMKTTQKFRVRPGKVTKVHYRTYLSESKFENFIKTQERRLAVKEMGDRNRNYSVSFQ